MSSEPDQAIAGSQDPTTQPPAWLRSLEPLLERQPVVVLLRHAARGPIVPPGGAEVPITQEGESLSRQLGAHLGSRLKSLRSSPIRRCLQTAHAIRVGSRCELAPQPDTLLGDPGIYVTDPSLANQQWERLGHEGVIRALSAGSQSLTGLAEPLSAARQLARHLLDATPRTGEAQPGQKATAEPGLHLAVTHDLLVVATASRLLHIALEPADWPDYLEPLLIWAEAGGVHVRYRGWEDVLALG